MFSRKFAVASLAFALTAGTASAQGFEVGRLDLGPTIGFGGGADGIAFGARIEKGIKQLPSLENGILSIAGLFTHYSWDCGFSDCGASYNVIGATVNYHFPISNKKWDPFIGLGLGYAVFSADCGSIDCGDSEIRFIGNAGVRYNFKENMSLYADVATGASDLNLGIMFKLK